MVCKGKAFATIMLDDLADVVQRNCSLKKSDCIAVNKELVEVILHYISNSARVKLDVFGRFEAGIVTKGSFTEKDFNVTGFVEGARGGCQRASRRTECLHVLL